MNVYAETSAVLRWLFNQERGDEIVERLRAATKVLCSRLTLVEAHRAIRRAEVGDEISAADAEELRASLAQAASRWAILEVSSAVATRAEAAFPAEPVRTLDALHLSSALALRNVVPDLEVVSTDRRVRKNAAQLGLEIWPPSEEPAPDASS